MVPFSYNIMQNVNMVTNRKCNCRLILITFSLGKGGSHYVLVTSSTLAIRKRMQMHDFYRSMHPCLLPISHGVIDIFSDLLPEHLTPQHANENLGALS